MSSAILYIRVSTDEQADKGYSQRNQDEVLQKYCNQRNIAISQITYEDHSAKTFNRPEWKKMLVALKKAKGKPDVQLILFTKWDRFSRNTADAYQMIGELRKMGIEPQAIEQPLDLSVPENKMMLAFYLAVPEVENDRRALNIMHGIRRAKKEGRWTGMAPVGYVNRSTETGRKYIRPDELQAVLMQTAFAELATGHYAVEEVWKRAKRKGLRGVRQNFWYNIRNPVYCGKILVPAYRDEPPDLVNGQHEALISETLFDQVQLVLTRRKRLRPVKLFASARFIFRGYLTCAVCGRRLTASASKGRSDYYHYYHCTAACGSRYNTKQVDAEFLSLLESLQAKRPYFALFQEIVRERFRQQNLVAEQRREQLSHKIMKLSDRISKARDLLLTGSLEPDDYQQVKTTSEAMIRPMQAELAALPDAAQNLMALVNRYKSAWLDLVEAWQHSAFEEQRRLFRYLFPTNITYTAGGFPKAAIPPAIRSMFKI
ncbi:MAG: recombinase family protein [Bacteroidota bacterium]